MLGASPSLLISSPNISLPSSVSQNSAIEAAPSKCSSCRWHSKICSGRDVDIHVHPDASRKSNILSAVLFSVVLASMNCSLCSAVLLPAVLACRHVFYRGRPAAGTLMVAAVLLNPASVLIDHGHLQYNGISLGLSVRHALSLSNCMILKWSLQAKMAGEMAGSCVSCATSVLSYLLPMWQQHVSLRTRAA